MQQRDDGWQPLFLRGKTARGQSVCLPVMARADRWGRFTLSVGDTATLVRPIDDLEGCCEEIVPAIIEALRSPFITEFRCWLPPWCVWRSPSSSEGGSSPCSRSGISPFCSMRTRAFERRDWTGTLTWRSLDVLVIRLQTSCENYIVKNVKARQRQHLRASYRAGVKVVSQPATELTSRYYELYSRVFDERKWVGQKLPLGFFQRAANCTDDAAELLVTTYEDRVIGGGVFLFDRYAVNFFQATTDRAVKKVYPHAVLYQRALEAAQKRGLRFINLGYNPGSSGLIRFKREWGAESTAVPMLHWRGGYRETKQNLLGRVGAMFGRCQQGNTQQEGVVTAGRSED